MEESKATPVNPAPVQQTVVVEKKKSSFLSGFSGTFGVVAAIILIIVLICCCVSALLIIPALQTVNPSKNISDARNTQRSADVQSIFDAVAQAEVDGVNLSSIPTCTSVPTGRNIGSKAGLVNLTPVLVPTYLASVPLDPQVGTETDTGYTICLDKTETGVLRVIAPNAENGVLLRLQSE